MSASREKKNIVVIGGSYVGGNAVKQLAERMYATHRTILVEKNTHFQWLFAFPRVAVVPGFERLAFIPYTRAYEGLPVGSAQVVRARATEVTPDSVILDNGEPIPYDFLMLATGTKLAPPGTLHTTDKQGGIAYFQQHQRHVQRARNIVVIGGGAVGVQLATDIKDYYPDKHVTLVHSRDRLMHKFHPKMHETLAARAVELDIDLVLGERARVPADGFPLDGSEFDITLQSGRTLRSDFAVLATGQTPNSDPLKTLAPACIAPSGFVRVKRTLQLEDTRFPRVFAVGDVADTPSQKTARVGLHHVDVATDNIAALARGELPAREYEDRGMGIHMSLGMTRDLKFRDPGNGQEPSVNLSEEGSQDLRLAERAWVRWAPGVTNYDL